MHKYKCTINNTVINNANEKVLIGRNHPPNRGDSNVFFVEFKNSRIIHIPGQVCDAFENLENIFAESSNLKMIGDLRSCRRLRNLVLSDNQITELRPELLGNYNFFRGLDLRSNKITKLPASAFKSVSNNFNSHWWFDDNPLERIEGTMSRIVNFRNLSFTNCKINAIDPNFFHDFAGAINQLDFSGNSCINQRFNNIFKTSVAGILPFFHSCFKNFAQIPPTITTTTAKPSPPPPSEFGKMICREDSSMTFYRCETMVSSVDIIKYKRNVEAQGFIRH